LFVGTRFSKRIGWLSVLSQNTSEKPAAVISRYYHLYMFYISNRVLWFDTDWCLMVILGSS
jgi:hypothetical protein